MSDSDCGPVLCYPIGRSLDDKLTANVNGASRFIKNEDLGLADDGASNGNTLALATGQLCAIFSNNCILSLQKMVSQMLCRVMRIQNLW